MTCYTFHVRLCARVWVIARSRSLWRVCVFALIYNFTLVRTTFIFVLIAFSCVSLMSPGSVLIAKQKHLAEHFQGTRKFSYSEFKSFSVRINDSRATFSTKLFSQNSTVADKYTGKNEPNIYTKLRHEREVRAPTITVEGKHIYTDI